MNLIKKFTPIFEHYLRHLTDNQLHNILKGNADSYILEVDPQEYWEMIGEEYSRKEIRQMQKNSTNPFSEFYEVHHDGSITGYDHVEDWENCDFETFAEEIVYKFKSKIPNFENELAKYCDKEDGLFIHLTEDLYKDWLNRI